jgi:hypothetical protein
LTDSSLHLMMSELELGPIHNFTFLNVQQQQKIQVARLDAASRHNKSQKRRGSVNVVGPPLTDTILGSLLFSSLFALGKWAAESVSSVIEWARDIDEHASIVILEQFIQ